MKPLEGVRILAIEQFGAGPYGSMFLSDLGAEVIKIENAETRGDTARSVGPRFLGEDDSEYFQSINTNKTSVTLDLKSTEGKKDKKDKKTRIIYHFVMHIKDESVEKTDKFLDVYVLTGEYESHLFSQWNLLPAIDKTDSWNTIKESKLKEFEKRLKSLKNPGNRVKLSLEFVLTKQGKVFCGFIETIFQ